MKFLILLGVFALAVGAFADKDSDRSEMISRGKKLVSEAENWVKSLENGPDPERSYITHTNRYEPWTLEKMVEKMESGSELSASEKEQFNTIEERMEEERKVFSGIFDGHETEPTGETLSKAAEAMIADAESKELTGEEKELLSQLEEQLERDTRWGYSKMEGGETLTRMVDLNEVTHFY